MDQALGVGRRETRCRLHADPQDFLQREGPLAVQPLLERPSGDVFHDQEGQARRLDDGVNGDDVLVDDRGRGPRFAEETPPRHPTGGE